MIPYKVKKYLATYSRYLGWKWDHLPAGLYVFNLHRIGVEQDTQFDPNVFSGSVQSVQSRLEAIRRKFRLISPRELAEHINEPDWPAVPLAMITFDDGYRDNFSLGLPLLQSLGISATFFVTTDFVGDKRLAWWDEAAWLVRNSTVEAISLQGMGVPLVIDRDDMQGSIRRVLLYFKEVTTIPLDDKLQALREGCGCGATIPEHKRLFMDWDEIGQLVAAGMEIGSHTCSHRLLAHLSEEEQLFELADSKRLIEEKVGGEVISLAYPVGGDDSFTHRTCALASQCGYRLAFTFGQSGAVAARPAGDPLRIPRLSLGAGASVRDLQCSVVFARRT